MSDVPSSDFSPDALGRRLNEVDSLAAIARGHEAVLDRLVAAGTVLPARIATLYRTDADVLRVIADRKPELRAAFARLDGVREWGVKAFVDRPRLLAWLRPADEAEPEPTTGGAAYLATRQAERALDRTSRAHVLAVTEELHASLRALAADARIVGGRTGRPGKAKRELVLNAAYLVPLEGEADFRSTVAGHANHLKERGFAVALTGPWPPYNFLGDVLA